MSRQLWGQVGGIAGIALINISVLVLGGVYLTAIVGFRQPAMPHPTAEQVRNALGSVTRTVGILGWGGTLIILARRRQTSR